MSKLRHIAVIDIGKTNVKLALVDLDTLTEVAVITRPNIVLPAPPYPHYDVEGHWAFLLDALKQFHRAHHIDAISITTHGACIALLDGEGALAAPILDYEHSYPPETIADYDAIKPAFADTGSPKLAGGLNVGAQLHWQFKNDPALKQRTKQIVTYPQYWGHRLTGVTATDVTSIGCHTDLWNPYKQTFSDLPTELGIQGKIAPVRHPSEILGSILPEIAQATGLDPKTPVCVGIHDSNASLYPHIKSQEGPFTVVSTGTWVIAMSLKGADISSIPPLDPNRDTLINVNAHGQAVASARFMGGREYEMIQKGQIYAPSQKDVADILDKSIMLLPAVEASSGPFQGRQMQWLGDEKSLTSGQRSAALSFYLALVTSTCLKLIDGTGPTIVEGPFAQNVEFISMLKTVTTRPVFTSKAVTGTSIGAALLFKTDQTPSALTEFEEADVCQKLKNYADLWLASAETLRS